MSFGRRGTSRRYLRSVYTIQDGNGINEPYELEDRYMTSRYYDRAEKPYDLLGAEKSEILARLRKVATEAAERNPPH